MLNIRRTVLALAVFAVSAAPLSAQVYLSRTYSPRGWLGISYQPVEIVKDGQRSGLVTITSVTKGSPAERAGVLAGDTLIRLNDFRATAELLGSMGASVEPGDTVRLIVRRGGKERTLTIEVAKRPVEALMTTRGAEAGFYTFDPDSVRGMMRIFVDSMYAGLDSSRMRVFHFDTAGARGTIFFRDSLMGQLPSVMFDSLHRIFPRMTDSMMRTLPRMHDTLMQVIPRFDMRFETLGEPARLQEGGLRTPGMVFRSIALSENAFAGADLADVNEDLGEYFGTRTGVLVLRVPDATPAARAGLEPGDIVTSVNGTAVTTTKQLRQAAEQVRRGAPIKLEVMRHRKQQTIELKRD